MGLTNTGAPMGMHCIMTGNPVDGFRIVGPFKVPSEAIEWATDHCTQEWWEVPLEAVEGFEG